MYELFLVACVGATICQYLAVPISYPTESRCRIAAALIAGKLRGTRNPGQTLKYDYDCERKLPVAELTPRAAGGATRSPAE